MADGTPIEWTDATWQIVTGCSVVSPGCTNCYAMRLAGTRMKHHPTRKGMTIDTKAGPVWTGEVRFNAELLTQPLRWKRPRKIFVAAHGDIFHEGVTDAQQDQIFAVMAACPQHVFQILTKRPDRMRAYLADPVRRSAAMAELGKTVLPLPQYREHQEFWVQSRVRQQWQGARERLAGCYLPNVWLGVSIEDQKRAEERIPVLLDIPAAVRWISAEPLLGPVNLAHVKMIDRETPGGGREQGWESVLNGRRFDPWNDEGGETEGHPRLDWVVAGGESGPGARPMHPDWARQLRDQCAAAGVAFLFKQWGSFAPAALERNVMAASGNIAWPDGTVGGGRAEDHAGEGTALLPMAKKAAGRLLDGRLHDGFPATSEARG